MALNQATKDRLKAIGIDPETLTTAVKDANEVDVKLPEGTLLTETQLTERDTIKIADGKKEGEKEAINIAKKEIQKHAGIEVKGERWGDIGAELKTAINSTGDAKLKTLQDQNAALLADNETFKAKATEADMQLQKGMFELEVMAKLPPHTAGLNPKESMELAKMRGYSWEKDGNNIVVKKNGEPIKDPNTHAPLALDAANKAIWTEQKWESAQTPPAPGGRGGQQKPTGAGTGGIQTQSEAQEAFMTANPNGNAMSPEYFAYVAQVAKDNPTFDYNK